MTLVTPVFLSTNIAPQAIVPTFGVLTLHFVPEPGTAILVGAGVVGLTAFGRSAGKRRQTSSTASDV